MQETAPTTSTPPMGAGPFSSVFATERSLRSFAVGPDNWTFFGSDNGGKTAAVLRSLVSSCELVRIDPFAWFRDVLSRIAEHPITRLEERLPHRWAQASR